MLSWTSPGLQKFAIRSDEGQALDTLPYISYIGMCRPKGDGFWAVLVWKRV